MLQGEGVSIEEKARGNQGPSLSPRGLIKSKLRCFLCHKLGNFKEDFPNKGGNGGSSVQVAVASDVVMRVQVH